MKRKANFGMLLTLVTIFFTSCSGEKEQSTNNLLHNTEKRKEIMTTICEDQDMMREMMDFIMLSDNAMQMMHSGHDMFAKMMGDKEMMKGKMMKDMPMSGMMMRNMMDMMSEDSSTCNMMSEMMMDNDHMMKMMMDMMHDKGVKMDKNTNCKKPHMDMHGNGEVH